MSPNEPGSPSPLPPRDAPLATRPLVLFVDDFRDYLLLIPLQLDAGQVEVLTAESGAAALALARDLAGAGRALAAAFVDVQMPFMGGVDCAFGLREIFPGLPLAFCTCNRDLVPVDVLADLGAAMCEKPMLRDDLWAQVERMVFPTPPPPCTLQGVVIEIPEF